MVNLIKADLYKETSKKSFKIFMLLILFVSILVLIILNSNIKLKDKDIEVYPLFSKSEYLDIYKYGNYKEYKKDYKEYLNVVSNIESIKDTKTKTIKLFENAINMFYFLGVIVIYIAFQNISYDYTSGVIKYVYLSSYSRKKIVCSKVLSNIIIAIFYTLLLTLTVIFTIKFITKETSLNYIGFNGFSFYKGNVIIYFIFKSIIYLIPMFFMIILTIFLTTLFKGSNFALVLSEIIYFCSLLLSQILFSYGIKFIKYTFIPYIDFTYYEDILNVSINNMIFNLNFSLTKSICYLIIYFIVFLLLTCKLVKKDV